MGQVPDFINMHYLIPIVNLLGVYTIIVLLFLGGKTEV